MIDKKEFLRKDIKDKKFFTLCVEMIYPTRFRKLCKDNKFQVIKFGN